MSWYGTQKFMPRPSPYRSGVCCICNQHSKRLYKVVPHGWMCADGAKSCTDCFFDWKKYGRTKSYWGPMPKKPAGVPSKDIEREEGIVT